ncbi:MAG TPA: adenylate kinase [Nostocaceae cyanobacterium]|nr:adenylate kinase [Nostocaceae cyanobacterium]
MQRISIVGTTSSGKSTLAKQISQRLGIPHIELDYLYWQPNWIETPAEIFNQQLTEKIAGYSWIVDGNYSHVRDLIWSKADTIIWLNYSLRVVLQRVIWRTFKRVITKQEVCNGNYETWSIALSKYSMIVYVLQTHYQRYQEYTNLFKKPEYSHLKIIELRTPAATKEWLSNLPIQQN